MKTVRGLLLPLLLLVIAGGIYLHRTELQDWAKLRTYDPPASIARLAGSAAMSEEGKRLFYVNEPELHGRDSFSRVCKGTGDENSNVLGCFTGSRIYVFDVEDAQLNGVKEVTAAHEMLHAAYIRLSSGERERVDKLIQKQLDTKTTPQVKELITIYNRVEPGELLNEMHSILATEQGELLPELNDYFKQYFTDRQKVVALASGYQSVFDKLKGQQEALSLELDKLATSINSGTAQLNADIQTFNSRVSQFNDLAESGTLSESAFQSQRTQLARQKDALNTRVAENDRLRETYESKRQQYEALAVKFNDLQSKIDSKPVVPKANPVQ